MGTRTLLLVLGLHFSLLGNLEAIVCPGGFIANGRKSCVDIDECKEWDSTPPCGSNATCYNTQGSFFCQCLPGFKSTTVKFTTLTGECKDLNECEVEPQVCGSNNICRNTIGSFNCQCRPGFTSTTTVNFTALTGECKDINGCFDCPCTSGFGERRNGDCNDESRVYVDECKEQTADCPNKSFCVNTPGSYDCICLSGYTLTESKRGCMDLDECQETPQVCGRNAICLNTFGSYHCQCQPGFRISNHTVKD
ncbi:adhesion G protein-coupled receptor E2-like isoform X1 [Salvelinus alpinus]|uniref:adhesion G protein-coupled receptor E2-like isoform X1 n=1 Tax=Salvelinus alpinus TaxID=8036 RepID=UPI0039FD7781